jgi:membrane-associated phospholipid phosphatase
VATIYFGWHYIADDLAGLVIGVVAVLLAGWGTGQLRRPAPAPHGDPAGAVTEHGRRPVTAWLRRRPQASPSVS